MRSVAAGTLRPLDMLDNVKESLAAVSAKIATLRRFL